MGNCHYLDVSLLSDVLKGPQAPQAFFSARTELVKLVHFSLYSMTSWLDKEVVTPRYMDALTFYNISTAIILTVIMKKLLNPILEATVTDIRETAKTAEVVVQTSFIIFSFRIEIQELKTLIRCATSCSSLL